MLRGPAIAIALAAVGCGDDSIEVGWCPHAAPVLAAPPPFTDALFVAHALGSPSGLYQTLPYTNSVEAFEVSYYNGYRAFEVDLITLGDGTVVAAHDGFEDRYDVGGEFRDSTRDDVEGHRLDGTYPVMFDEDIIELVVAHPDIWMILDNKWDEAAIDQRMIDLAPDDSVRDRLVPHVVSDEHADALATIYPFPELLYARYQWGGTDSEIPLRMAAHGITNVMMWWDSQWNESLQATLDADGYQSWVHSPEDLGVIDGFVARGVGVYTNGYVPCAP